MSFDRRLRRRARAGPGPGDAQQQAAWLRDAARAGLLDGRRLRWAAGLGHPAAGAACGGEPLPRGDWQACLKSRALDSDELRAFACDCLERVAGATPRPAATRRTLAETRAWLAGLASREQVAAAWEALSGDPVGRSRAGAPPNPAADPGRWRARLLSETSAVRLARWAADTALEARALMVREKLLREGRGHLYGQKLLSALDAAGQQGRREERAWQRLRLSELLLRPAAPEAC